IALAARPDRLVRHPRHRLALLPRVRDRARPRARGRGHDDGAGPLGRRRLDRRPWHLGDAADEVLRAAQDRAPQGGVMSTAARSPQAEAGTIDSPAEAWFAARG